MWPRKFLVTVGCPIILQSNIDHTLGWSNDTQFIVRAMNHCVIQSKFLRENMVKQLCWFCTLNWLLENNVLKFITQAQSPILVTHGCYMLYTDLLIVMLYVTIICFSVPTSSDVSLWGTLATFRSLMLVFLRDPNTITVTYDMLLTKLKVKHSSM